VDTKSTFTKKIEMYKLVINCRLYC